jgi:starch synthase
MTAIKVLAVTSEIYPLVKTGGLADVAGALPFALRRHGVEMVTLVPGYPAVMNAIPGTDPVANFDEFFGGSARLLRAHVSGLDLIVIDAPHLFDRPGNPYSSPGGGDWGDNALRFGALSWTAARIGLGAVPDFVPDIVHGHDWQAGLVMAYLAYDGGPRPATMLTVHNLAFQGQFPPDLLEPLKLPAHAFAVDGVEHHGAIGFLKAGLQFADRITTVSPTYAREIQTSMAGFGFEGLLRHRQSVLVGICNGIDTDVWNPETDDRIVSRFGPSSLAARASNRSALQERFGLATGNDGPLFAVVSRMAWQKGLDLLADAVPAIVTLGGQLVVLGAGDTDLERRYQSLAASQPSHVGCVLGHDEDLAHLIQAGADAILIPSRFEPCGLTQLCAMRYGAVPIASKVGGLADTIIDRTEPATNKATGLHFHPVTQDALEAALMRAVKLWKNQANWRRLQANGMRTDVSWSKPAGSYSRLYADLLQAKN